MLITHYLGILSINKNIDDNIGFLLTDKKGSYCSFFNKPASRYYGFFYFDNKSMKMYKFVENIEIVGHNNIDYVKNWFYFAERKKGDVIETFTMPKGFNSLIYETSSENEIDIILDCKESYDNREWGRNYDILEIEKCIVVKFTKKTDLKEDSSNGEEEFTLYLAIKSDSNFYEKNDKWIERRYIDDEKRKSPPFNRYVYNALRLKGTKFVFSVSKNKNSAIKESEFVFNNLNDLKQKEKEHFFNMLKNESLKKIIANDKVSKEVKMAYVSAANSLNNLIVYEKNQAIVSEFESNARARVTCESSPFARLFTTLAHFPAHSHSTGIFAGLPWFFQFWSRDALISLKPLSKINKNLAEKILLGYLKSINDDGRLPNLIGEHSSKSLGSADAVGWLFLRCDHLIDKINKDKETINSIKKSMYWIKQSKLASAKNIRGYIKRCNSIIGKKEKEFFELLYKIENSLEKSVNGLLKFRTKDNFDFNEAKETWMDTDFGGDDRKGTRIELQALRLSIYNLGFELTQNHKYKVLENTLKTKMRQKFWNGNILADGLDDWTIRPNLFIAAYVYPELLTQKEWETCFENALKSLWLNWGGLSTIDRNNKLFTEIHTGENSKSYHRGDSWFWLNNLAAIQLKKINNKKFQKQIQKIIEASTEEILWKGCIGCASELSSAKELSPTGCFNQAWSNAMYMEMIDEIYAY